MNFITGTVECKEDPTCSERCNLCSCKKKSFPGIIDLFTDTAAILN